MKEEQEILANLKRACEAFKFLRESPRQSEELYEEWEKRQREKRDISNRRYIEAWRMRHVMGFTYPMIGKSLGVSAGWARQIVVMATIMRSHGRLKTDG
jgi:membrane protein YqaA with SNARE-associated domain